MSMMELYERETGGKAAEFGVPNTVGYYTSEYVHWLEEKAAKPEAVSRPLCDGWRDMQKEPPTTTDEVMFYSRTERIIEIGRYINGKCYGRSGMYRDGQVSAWRELPAPPAFA